MADLTLTSGDTAPRLTMTCGDGGVAASLVGATVAVHIQRSDGTVINRAGTIDNAALGTVYLDWITGDLTVAGSYYVEAQVTYSDARVQTFGRPRLIVQDQIA